MKSYKSKIHLGWFFILAVVIPSLILSFMAIRSINREEAYIEKQLRNALLAEISHVASLVNRDLKEIQQELNGTIDLPKGEGYASYASHLKKTSPLVKIPFFLSPRRDILWPQRQGTLPDEEKFFLKWGRDFFMDKEATPVFENIAVVYKDKIIDEAQILQGVSVSSPQMQAEDRQGASSRGNYSQKSSVPSDAADQLFAKSQFEQHEPIRQEVYKEAKQKGKKILNRNIFSRKTVRQNKRKSVYEEPEESIFVSESLNFSEIIEKSTNGIIPLFIKDKLHLLFWKKDLSGYIVGCLINQNSLIERIIHLLPNIYSEARILTILNENGNPIVSPSQKNSTDWRRPFVSMEISEWLPRWETAAYLADARIISTKAQTRALFMWALILILLVSIVSGGTLILKSLYYEIRLAQQKTTFAANVSHELKTPLTSIRMFSEMLREKRQPDEEKRHQYLGIILSETERLTRLINNVLDFSRRGKKKKSYQFKDIDLVLLCRNIIEDQRMRLEYNGFNISFSSATDSIFIQIDEEAIKQVLLNLLSNAEKYSAKIKKIDIEIIPKEGFVIIHIKDRGIGISPRHVKMIFDEFYRINDSLTAKTRGIGLGLTIARGIARDHGGDIFYLPREGGGSIFQVELKMV